MARKVVRTYVSLEFYKEMVRRKEKIRKENVKKRKRKKRIDFVDASNDILKQVRRK